MYVNQLGQKECDSYVSHFLERARFYKPKSFKASLKIHYWRYTTIFLYISIMIGVVVAADQFDDPMHGAMLFALIGALSAVAAINFYEWLGQQILCNTGTDYRCTMTSPKRATAAQIDDLIKVCTAYPELTDIVKAVYDFRSGLIQVTDINHLHVEALMLLSARQKCLLEKENLIAKGVADSV